MAQYVTGFSNKVDHNQFHGNHLTIQSHLLTENTQYSFFQFPRA